MAQRHYVGMSATRYYCGDNRPKVKTFVTSAWYHWWHVGPYCGPYLICRFARGWRTLYRCRVYPCNCVLSGMDAFLAFFVLLLILAECTPPASSMPIIGERSCVRASSMAIIGERPCVHASSMPIKYVRDLLFMSLLAFVQDPFSMGEISRVSSSARSRVREMHFHRSGITACVGWISPEIPSQGIRHDIPLAGFPGSCQSK